MSSILFLSTDDFLIEQTEETNILCHEIRGFSLILFYSTQCEYCQKIIPIFKRLPRVVNGCQFGMLNVSMNKTLISQSQSTNTAIKYVPLIILYINGRPYMRYEGPHEEQDIRQFIIEISNRVQAAGFQKTIKEKGIPAYTIGQPLCGDGEVCYLEFDTTVGYKKSV